MITHITLDNIRALGKVDIDLEGFVILYGANGTGKSTFADTFQFVSDVMNLGLPLALGQRGQLAGYRRKSKRKPFKLQVEFKLGLTADWGISQARYGFSLKPTEALKVDEEWLEGTFFPRKRGRRAQDRAQNYDRSAPKEIRYRIKGGKVDEAEGLESARSSGAGQATDLALRSIFSWSEAGNLLAFLQSMRCYALQPSRAREMQPLSETSELSTDGSNLVSVIRYFRNKQPKRLRSIISAVREVIPFVKSIEDRQVVDQGLLVMAESDSELEIEAMGMSDGTLRVLSMLVSLMGPIPPSVVTIEEPENALHPAGIEKVVDVIWDAVQDNSTQVILTSHSPHVVDAAYLRFPGVAPQVLVARRQAGKSVINSAPPALAKVVSNNVARPSEFWLNGGLDDFPEPPDRLKPKATR